MSKDIEAAAHALQQGGIIAYPTEAVYGFGCDPFNETAVLKLLAIKQRDVKQGLLLIAANWEQVCELTLPIPTERMAAVMQSWPGPQTWLFPASNKAPTWICGEHDTIALRITDHPIASALCLAFGGPIVSTSANLAGQAPARDPQTVAQLFSKQLATIVHGELGGLSRPTPITDAVSGKELRT